jgi:glycolate oxidase FAD binding subunit
MPDHAQTIVEQVNDAIAAKRALSIRGGGSKSFFGATQSGELLDVRAHSGVIDYEPRELVLSVRAGTPLTEIEAALAAENQMLPFEPPHFGGGATIGGTVATGLSGPRRPYAGAARDFLLGARILSGKGEDLSFGGRVIKNVAGYDVSRLMCGAHGTLGVLLDLSFKVLPKPADEVTLAFECDEATAIARFNEWAGKPLPLSACAWSGGQARVRLSGAKAGVRAARAKLGGELLADGAAYWLGLRDHRHAFFASAANGTALWRLSLPSTTPPLKCDVPQLIEWGGALRWMIGSQDAVALRSQIGAAGGHATLFRGGDKSAGVFHPLDAVLARIHRNLKNAFDPDGILNPGRMDNF